MTPTTKAGRALLRDGSTRRLHPAHLEEYVVAIEREAAAQERERIQREVDALPDATGEKMRTVGRAVMRGEVRAILAEPSDD